MYTSFYKLTGKPFQLSPDPRFFFGSSGHKRAMSYLRYGLSQSEGFIVITGGIGTGKTTLVKNLFAELDPEKVIAAELVTTQLDADDMLTMVVAAFGIDYEGVSKAVLIKRLEDFLAAHARDGRRVLLIVDEAQNLPAKTLEELRMLSNFQIADKPLLQSFLLGQEEFRSTLQAPGLEQLRQRIIASCHLSALNEDETKGYIEHRLGVVGWESDPAFESGSIGTIHEMCEGIPRRINILCDRLMLYGYLEELHAFGTAEVKEVAKEIKEELSPPETRPQPAPIPDPIEEPGAGDGSSEPQRGPPAQSPKTEPAGAVDELEAAVAQLSSRNAEVQDHESIERLERRMEALERKVQTLTEGFLQMSKVLREKNR
jgi:putative secretion ATPase (PEP-CTERM system associated)